LRATLKIIKNSDEARKKLKENSEYIRKNLDLIGYNIESESHIVSIESGLESDTELLRDELERRGVFGAVFCSPATPKNRSVIRLSINSSLRKEDLDRILNTCEEIKDIVGMKNWRSTKKKINKSGTEKTP
jgi:CAI-1 autoinducer synthase